MKLYTLEQRRVIPATLDEVWAFFSDPHNLARLTPPALNLVVPADTPHEIHGGMIITYRIRAIAGLPMTWVTEISQVDAGRLFVDELRFGPYRFWHHQHHFREVAGGVEVRDLVHYAMPLGPLGGLVHALMVKAQLREIFAFRAQAIERLFGPDGMV